MCSCCLGETISRPLYESLATLITDPVPESVVRQILKDEHLHARFGWETLEWLWPRLGDEERAWLQRRLARRLAGFELSCAPNHRLEDLVGEEICVEAPPADAPPNLGHLPSRTYAGIFYATLEAEIFPHFQAIGLDPMLAWQERAAAYRQKW